MFKTIREIRAVGLADWLWFVFALKRNEFHDSLTLQRKDGVTGAREKMQKRNKAHEISLALSDLK